MKKQSKATQRSREKRRKGALKAKRRRQRARAGH